MFHVPFTSIFVFGVADRVFLGSSYIGSRIFLHNPPGDDNALQLPTNVYQALHEREHEIENEQPKMGPIVCVITIAISIALMAVTAEFLVESIEEVIKESNIREE